MLCMEWLCLFLHSMKEKTMIKKRKKKEIKKEIVEKEITCEYCQENVEKFCKVSGRIVLDNQEICKHFVARNIFYCRRHFQRYDLVTCLNRFNCVKHRVRLYYAFEKCKKCPQHAIIKKIAEQEDIEPPQIVNLKRRSKPSNTTKIRRRNDPVTILKRRSRIKPEAKTKRRQKPKTIIRRRN
jgi:hypothetical protein